MKKTTYGFFFFLYCINVIPILFQNIHATCKRNKNALLFKIVLKYFLVKIFIFTRLVQHCVLKQLMSIWSEHYCNDYRANLIRTFKNLCFESSHYEFNCLNLSVLYIVLCICLFYFRMFQAKSRKIRNFWIRRNTNFQLR